MQDGGAIAGTATASEASGGGRVLATLEGVVERLTYVNPQNGHNATAADLSERSMRDE